VNNNSVGNNSSTYTYQPNKLYAYQQCSMPYSEPRKQ
jgi:hypothetical protein